MKNTPIKMKKTAKSSNPSKYSVLCGGDDDVKRYIREIASIKILRASEEREIAQKAAEGDKEAKKQLVQSNLKLVITIAKKAIHMSSIPLIDLIQEGNLGLMIAAEKFNYKLGYKFSTYAAWWIKQSMFKAISEQGHCMKIPVYIQETLSKFSKIKKEMENEYNCQVKNKDVAAKMNLTEEKIESYLSAYTKTISIEGGFNSDESKELNVADILEDENQSVCKNVEFEELKDDIKLIVSTLKDREQEVLKMRFGLENFAKRTLEEIGNLYGVTKECIRQTELRALKKIRMNAGDLLSCYIA